MTRASLRLGLLLTGAMAALALASLVWTPHPPEQIDMARRLLPPGGAHWLGTDQLGRDLFSRLMAGARSVWWVGSVAVGLGLLLGTLLGLLAAACRGAVEQAVLRACDLGFAFPALLLAILLAAALGPGTGIAMLAIGLHAVPGFARLVNGSAKSWWSRDFVLAARAAGRGRLAISLQHVLPQLAPLLIVQGTTAFALALLAEAALSYLGLGSQPPEASLGRMLAEAQTLWFEAPQLAIYPGLAITLTVLGLNLLGDGLRDRLDPRENGVAPSRPAPAPAVAAAERLGAALPRAGNAAPAPLLQVRDLQVWLPDARAPGRLLHALRGLDFTLDAGQSLALVGESGSGKTLCALALMGLLPEGARVQGQVLLGGEDLLALDEAAWCRRRGRELAMVFQEPLTALDALQRVVDQVAEPLRLHGLAPGPAAAREQALALLARVGLEGRLARAYPHELSGGQRQRALIATALAAGPRLLIADEPTTALDPRLRAQVLELLMALVAERDMALLLISHDLAQVARRLQRAAILYGGRMMETVDPAAALLQDAARHPYTRALWAARPRLGAGRDQPLRPLAGTVPALAELGAGCPFAPRCPRAQPRCADEPPPWSDGLACWAPDR